MRLSSVKLDFVLRSYCEHEESGFLRLVNVRRRKVVLKDAIDGRQVLAIFIVGTSYDPVVLFAQSVVLFGLVFHFLLVCDQCSVSELLQQRCQ